MQKQNALKLEFKRSWWFEAVPTKNVLPTGKLSFPKEAWKHM